MAWFQVNFASQSLKRPVSVNVLIPMESRFGMPEKKEKLYKTVYLLHGYGGDYAHWLTNTTVIEMAQLNDLAIVMPCGENSFYMDIENSGRLYSTYIGRELVNFTRKAFPLSRKREDTVVAGLSMGGYGAIYNGLRHNDVFGNIVALSSALVPGLAENATAEPNLMGISRGFYEEIAGDIEKIRGSDRDPEVLAKRVLERGENVPGIYLACGYNDALVYDNRRFSAYLTEIGYEHVYEEGAGTHQWAFWDSFIRRGIESLGLEPKGEIVFPSWVDAGGDSPNPVVP